MSTIPAAPATTPSGRDRSGGHLGWWWNGVTRHAHVPDEIRLDPSCASPQHDQGHDVSDHPTGHPEHGGPAAFDGVIRDEHRPDIEVIDDAVPDRCPEDGETLPANGAGWLLLEEMS